MACEIGQTVAADAANAVVERKARGGLCGGHRVPDAAVHAARKRGRLAGVVDPEVFVIGGGVSRAGDILIEGIQKKYSEIVFQACRETKVTLATLGNDAGMYGCVKLLF